MQKNDEYKQRTSIPYYPGIHSGFKQNFEVFKKITEKKGI